MLKLTIKHAIMIQKKILYIFTLLFLCFFLNTNAQDCDPPLNVKDGQELIENVQGYGITIELAIKDAKRSAINRTAGSYLQSKTTIKDNSVIDDIFEYNKGLVDAFCVISEKQEGEEDWRVSINAVIAKELFLEEMKASGYKIKIGGISTAKKLKSNNAMIKSEKKSVQTLLNQSISSDPFTYSVSQSSLGQIFNTDLKQKVADTLNFYIRLSIAVKPNYGNFFKNLESGLKNNSNQHYNEDMILSIKNDKTIYFPISDKNNSKMSDWPANKILFINKINSMFQSNEFSDISKLNKKDSERKKQFLQKFNGTNYHVNASIMSFRNASLYKTITEKLNSHIKSDNFSLTFLDELGDVIGTPIEGFYDNIEGSIKIDGRTSTKSSPYSERYIAESIQTVREEYVNLKKEQINLLTSNDLLTYVTNEEDIYKKPVKKSVQKFKHKDGLFTSYLGAIGSLAPAVLSFDALNKWSSSDISPHGFSSTYNPKKDPFLVSSIVSGLAFTYFGIKIRKASVKRKDRRNRNRVSKFSQPDYDDASKIPKGILKVNDDLVSVFCSDTDYLNSTVTSDALKKGLITDEHEIFDWEIYIDTNFTYSDSEIIKSYKDGNRSSNNTLAVFYIEIPVKLDEYSLIDKVIIKSIKYNEIFDEDESDFEYSKPISYVKIIDPDGYTNVRAGKSTNTKIILQISDENKLFELLDDTGNWWKIKLGEFLTGYIYRTKVEKVEK